MKRRAGVPFAHVLHLPAPLDHPPAVARPCRMRFALLACLAVALEAVHTAVTDSLLQARPDLRPAALRLLLAGESHCSSV